MLNLRSQDFRGAVGREDSPFRALTGFTPQHNTSLNKIRLNIIYLTKDITTSLHTVDYYWNIKSSQPPVTSLHHITFTSLNDVSITLLIRVRIQSRGCTHAYYFRTILFLVTYFFVLPARPFWRVTVIPSSAELALEGTKDQSEFPLYDQVL
jgi:hypothetical protein